MCLWYIAFFDSFGGGEFLPVLVHGTNCTGNESRLADCSNTTFDAPCDYTKNVAITCNGKVITVICCGNKQFNSWSINAFLSILKIEIPVPFIIVKN